METLGSILSTILSPIFWLLGWVLSIVWAIVWYLLWVVIWLVLPFALVAFVALRVAEKALGPDVVRAWVKAQSIKYGAGVWTRAHRLLFALGALPLRVLGWLMVYTLWHSLISLLWKPRWKPWTRAWDKRWKPPQAAGRAKAGRTTTAKAR
jgi:hypothetical protein